VKIIILNGSPKGKLSITLQYVNFIKKKFPEHTYKIHHISERINRIAHNDNLFQEIMDDIGSADAVIWSFPIYVLLIPSQLKRFIELVFEKRAKKYFRNKYTVSLSTSLRFYDHTAHNYLHGICDDLNMRYWTDYSADMQDLMDETQREKLLVFAEEFFHAVASRLPTTKVYDPVVTRRFTYKAGDVKEKVDNNGRRILILTDLEKEKSNLGRMIDQFKNSFTDGVEIANINDIEIKGGCIGCVQCGLDNKCIYMGKDGFIDFCEETYFTADAVVFAPEIKDRYFSWKWKQFLDRNFYRGHTPGLKGKQTAYILSGPLKQLENLRQIIQAKSEMGYTNLVDIVTDESENDKAIDRTLYNAARRMMWCDERQYVKPPSFLYVGGHKIFRDLVWSRRAIFQADYKYYRKHKMFDFPQKDKKAAAFNKQMMSLMKDPKMKEEIRKMMKTQAVRPHMEVVAKE